MNELLSKLSKELDIAERALKTAEANEIAGGYDYELTLERKYCEGYAEAAEMALSIAKNAIEAQLEAQIADAVAQIETNKLI